MSLTYKKIPQTTPITKEKKKQNTKPTRKLDTALPVILLKDKYKYADMPPSHNPPVKWTSISNHGNAQYSEYLPAEKWKKAIRAVNKSDHHNNRLVFFVSGFITN